jgi:hypothetical protein
MNDDLPSLPRRDFLSQCAAASLAASIAPSAAAAATGDETIVAAPRKSEADLGRAVDDLFKLIDPRLHYRRVPVAPENNAWPIWAEARQFFVPLPADEEFRGAFDEFLHQGATPSKAFLERISGWVRQNKRCRELIEAGTARGQLELPRSGRGVRLPMAPDETDAMRDFSTLLTVASRVRFLAGDVEGALDAALAALAMGVLQLHAECLIVDLLVASANISRGIRNAVKAALHEKATAIQQKRAIAGISRAAFTPESIAAAYRVEFCRWFLPTLAGYPDTPDFESVARHYAAELLDVGDTGAPPSAAQVREAERFRRDLAALLAGHPRPFDKQATVHLAGKLYLSHNDSLALPWRNRRQTQLDGLVKEFSAWPEEVSPDDVIVAGLWDDPPKPAIEPAKLRTANAALRKIDNVFGKHLVEQATGTMDSLYVPSHQSVVAAAQLRIALRMFEVEHGNLPARLAELSEQGFLPVFPLDPFDGQPFKYSADRRVLWCIGRDGRNDGQLGNQDQEAWLSEDSRLTWRL